jgi:hypothetical protein
MAAGPGEAQKRAGVAGDFSLIMMAHTSSSTFGDLPGVNPWDGKRRAGTTFRYRSIPCTGLAPVNNISSDLPSYGARVPESKAPSSLRAHPFQFKLRKVDGKWQMRGKMTLTVCQLKGGPTPDPDPVPDADKPKINLDFTATFNKHSSENLNWSGTFRLRGGTGRYEDLTGSGTIGGYLFCFAPDGCKKIGKGYLDTQMVLKGKYEDPTPQL